jgi:hypothetical protein
LTPPQLVDELGGDLELAFTTDEAVRRSVGHGA